MSDRQDTESDDPTEAALIALERAGATVSWSDCAGCGKPRDEHGPGLICPRE